MDFSIILVGGQHTQKICINRQHKTCENDFFCTAVLTLSVLWADTDFDSSWIYLLSRARLPIVLKNDTLPLIPSVKNSIWLLYQQDWDHLG